eukprot:PhF_6_TR3672/c0_g1_i1/m.5180
MITTKKAHTVIMFPIIITFICLLLAVSDVVFAVETVNPDSFFWRASAVTSISQAGFSWYTHIHPMFSNGLPDGMQVGLGGTWLSPYGIDFGKTCACNPAGWPNNSTLFPGDNMNGCCDTPDRCGGLYQTFEGGPGYWFDELPTDIPKWRAGSSSGCYDYCVNSPLWCGGLGPPRGCGSLGIVAFSNSLLFAPDGLGVTDPGFLGVAYVRTPLGKVTATDNRNYWTIVLDAANFAGPVAYWTPEFWASRAQEYEKESAGLKDLGTSPGLSTGADGMEWNTIQTLKNNNTGLYKVPKLSFPYPNGRSVITMGNRGYNNTEIEIPIENAIVSGVMDVSKIMAKSTRAKCIPDAYPAPLALDARGVKIEIGTLETTIEDDECVWSVRFNKNLCTTSPCTLPEYFTVNGTSMSTPPKGDPLATSTLPKKSQPTTAPNNAWDALTPLPSTFADGKCIDSPGPAVSDLNCTKTAANTWVAWRWYKFVDQPSLQRAKLTSAQRDYLQTRIVQLHKLMTPRTQSSKWIKTPPSIQSGKDGGLGTIDPALLVTPPLGMEYGYVPIVLFEGLTQPKNCFVVSSVGSKQPQGSQSLTTKS